MGFTDIWNRTLVYFGIAEEEDWDEDGYVTEEELERTYSDRPNVRRLAPTPPPGAVRRLDGSGRAAAGGVELPQRLRCARGSEAVESPGSVRMHLVIPRSFNDAQQIADRFKQDIPVILNLQSSDQELSKRLIDFASGLTYALDGGMQRVADKVFLLTPQNVEVSAEERARLLERGGFFNQA